MIRWVLVLLACLIAFHGAPVVAQGQCGTHAGMMAQLDREYSEGRIGLGLSGPMSAFEIWVSAETGTWTILQIYPNGMACVRASGERWQSDVPYIPGDPA